MYWLKKLTDRKKFKFLPTNSIKKWKINALLTDIEILFPQTAVLFKRLTQTTECRNWWFQRFAALPNLTPHNAMIWLSGYVHFGNYDYMAFYESEIHNRIMAVKLVFRSTFSSMSDLLTCAENVLCIELLIFGSVMHFGWLHQNLL